MVVVERLSLTTIGGIFIFYILTHFGVGKIRDYYEERLEEKPDNKEIQKNVKIAQILFKWYPFIYLAIVLLLWYATYF